LFALHLAGQTRQIKLDTAIICLDLHHPLNVAEEVAVTDLLARGRLAVGFGSGCTPQELSLFEMGVDESQRHARFEIALRRILDAWACGQKVQILPVPLPDLPSRCWVAANSVGAARIAGSLNFNMLFSHLRMIQEYRELKRTYVAAGGTRMIAANRPIFVGADDESAERKLETTLRLLWRRFQSEGKISSGAREPESVSELSAHPVNFIVGGPQRVAAEIRELHRQAPFDVLNVELRWPGLSHASVCDSLRRLMTEVVPKLQTLHAAEHSG
jgi:alkanesulfonate monooxygenase SsuD/methylene tetrahydromethanopterin reductase-like flavin-dependent oxidoreductase (luciferase family)